ncbi:MAG TPA: MFS transporter [Acidobacteriaceae bacterium]|nr:MFS transporter [Acidobacteriaceae bacterium]
MPKASTGSPTGSIVQQFRTLSAPQRSAFLASFLGWSLDSLDFFLLILCIPAIAAEFHATATAVAEAVFLTLVFRPVGALLFGWMADQWGRKPTLIVNIIAYSAIELACAFAPSLHALLILRALFGVAMGGIWGVGAALAFESLPTEGRGKFSGLLQEGYAVGYLLAAALFGVVFHWFPWMGWRGLFMIGAAPALLGLYVHLKVKESPAWREAKAKKATRVARPPVLASLWSYLPTFVFVIVLMTAFTSFSHGTQDIYPTFLQKGLGFTAATVGVIGIIYNVGSLLGGLVFGSLSERWGRKRAIIVAALLAIPAAFPFAYGHSVWAVAAGSFVMQFLVQGAWGVVPAYLTELSPAPVRAIFPGLAYQLGNLLTSRNLVIQTKLADKWHGYPPVLLWTVILVAAVLAVVTAFGRESRGTELLAE